MFFLQGQNCFLLKIKAAKISKTVEINIPELIVNTDALPMFKIVGIIGIAEIWFPPYMTRMAPTRTEGEATPINTPAALETAIMDILTDTD